jgi:lipopolysaccharide transport system ATP-binding protein
MIADQPTLAESDPVPRPATPPPVAIDVRGVGKMYRMYNRPVDRLKHMLLWRFGRSYGREFWAVRGVSFDVRQGETVGIIGRNGSGKSTLLQIIAGTLAPNQGEVRVNGRVAALLELGSGFNPQFTGRENVFLNGAVLGFSREEMERRFDDIVAFADIGAFIDQPVKTYSSGMVVRLAFAVQSHIEPDVLIVDEALSVGDIFFQQKCFNHIRRLQERGVTLLYVSHDLISIQSICDRAILMKDGAAIFDGNPNEAVNRYYQVLGEQIGASRSPRPDGRNAPATVAANNAESPARQTILRADGPRHGGRGLEVAAAWVCDDAGQDTLMVMMMGALRFCVLLKANQPVEAPNLGMHLYDRLGNLVFAIGTTQLRRDLPSLDAGDQLEVYLRVELRVRPGEYTFNLVAGEPAQGDNPNIGFIHDSHEQLGPLKVQLPPGLLPFYGTAQLPATADYEFKGQG